MVQLAVIADDLTGANDTGVQFAKAGLDTIVLLDHAWGGMAPDQQVAVFDTDSRYDRASAAYRKVYRLAELLRQAGVQNIYKKVDSTLRGNIGAEIEAAVKGTRAEFAVIAPAFPRNCRITVGGYHLLNQEPLESTEVARDPKTPVTESRLPKLLRQQTKLLCNSIALATVIEGERAIKAAILEGLQAHARLLVFDATTQQHLVDIARAVCSLRRNVLWVGSAGLAEVLPQAMGWATQAEAAFWQEKSAPVLVVSGSVSAVTAKQIEVCLDTVHSGCVAVDPQQLLVQPLIESERCINEAKRYLADGRDAVLFLNSMGPDIVRQTFECGKQRGLPAPAVSSFLAMHLGRMVSGILPANISGMILTGGDTAVSVCRAVGANGVRMLRELEPGIPLGQLHGGKHAGMTVVTKAGAFGSEQAIANAMALLKGEGGQ